MTETFPEGEETAGWIVKLAEEIARSFEDGIDSDDPESIGSLICVIRGAVEHGSMDPVTRALHNENERLRNVMEEIRTRLGQELS